jgi:putative (di)nucleoside polyphosphate hydrolase
VFVGCRNDMPPGLSAWQMPQGGIDSGESPAEAAMRELEEETGTDKAEIVAESRDWHLYDIPPEVARSRWGGKYRGQRQKWFVMRFLGKDSDINIDTRDAEFGDWKWIAPAELPDLIVGFKRAIYIALIEEFREHLGL